MPKTNNIMNNHRFIDNNGMLCEMDIDRMQYQVLGKAEDIANMISPVRCTYCGEIYDLCDGKVNHRFADCTEFYTPCCNALVDDRPWLYHFTKIE
jgi:hypothetical protein